MVIRRDGTMVVSAWGAQARKAHAEVPSFIDDVIKARLAGMLKADGYRKSAHTFWRTVDGVTRIVNVQASSSNQAGHGSFTINLGLYVPAVVEMLGEEPLPSPKEYDCMVRERIGSLMPDGHDYWWEFDASTSAQQLGGTVALQFERFGVPWLERLGSMGGLCAHFELVNRQPKVVPSPESIALAVVMNRRESAERWLTTAIANGEVEPFIERCRVLAKRLGLRV